MAKRIAWKQGDLVSLKLREDLYAVAQMVRNSVMRFYAASNATGDWHGLVTDTTPVLFSGFVGKIVLRQLAVEQFQSGSPLIVGEHERYWLRPVVNFEGGFPFRGADLVDLGADCALDYSVISALEQELTLPASRDLIERHELTNMWGDADLSDRLCRYFDTGVNRDDLKFVVFPGLWPDRESLRPLTRRLPVPLR